MSELAFVDTNVLVYARDASEPTKGKRARSWLRAVWEMRCGRTSYQVLNEYYVTVTQKLDPGMTAAAARSDVMNLMAWRPVVVDGAAIEGAFEMQDRHALSWWDALVVAAARIAGCHHLLTEDLQDGQRFGDLVVVDPFRNAVEEVLDG